MSAGEKCYICGSAIANTKDHLFPKGLFNKPLPTNLPTLPACRECNNTLSSDEERFRVFLAAGIPIDNQSGLRIWMEKVRPALKGGRPRLRPLIRSYLRLAKVVSKSSALLGNTLILEMDRDIINRVMRKIVKGLYYLDTGTVIPENVQILVDYAYDKPERFISPALDEAIKGAKRVDLGNGEVTYWRNIIKDDPANSITWFLFYGYKLFMVCTYPTNEQ